MVCYGMVWCVVLWCGVMWCGVVWCGMVWYAMLCRGDIVFHGVLRWGVWYSIVLLNV